MIKNNDNIVSQIIKIRDPICRLKLTGCTHYTDDPMHVFGRRNMSTRWNLDTIFGGCRNCHSYIDTHPEQKELIFKRIIGEEEYNNAQKYSNSIIKFLPSDLKQINKKLKKILIALRTKI